MRKEKISNTALGWVMSEYEEQENLRELVLMLNDYSGASEDWKGKRYGEDDATRLRRWVRVWRKSGHDFLDLEKGLESSDIEALNRFTRSIRAQVNRTTGRMMILDYTTDEAAFQFNRLLNNSRQNLLGGPCRRCSKWYVKKTRRLSVFCSPLCAGNATKTNSRANKRRKKVGRVRSAIRNYQTSSGKYAALDWKEYVTKAVDGVSKNWLTRAVKDGVLYPPKKGVRHATN